MTFQTPPLACDRDMGRRARYSSTFSPFPSVVCCMVGLGHFSSDKLPPSFTSLLPRYYALSDFLLQMAISCAFKG